MLVLFDLRGTSPFGHLAVAVLQCSIVQRKKAAWLPMRPVVPSWCCYCGCASVATPCRTNHASHPAAGSGLLAFLPLVGKLGGLAVVAAT